MVLKKNALARGGNYIFLIPFILAYRPLILRFHPLEFILFSVGTIMVLAIIIISNRRPYIILKEDRLILNLHYYQEPEIHKLQRITLVEMLNSHCCRIHSRDFKPVRLNLPAKGLKKLMKELSSQNIRIKRL